MSNISRNNLIKNSTINSLYIVVPSYLICLLCFTKKKQNRENLHLHWYKSAKLVRSRKPETVNICVYHIKPYEDTRLAYPRLHISRYFGDTCRDSMMRFRKCIKLIIRSPRLQECTRTSVTRASVYHAAAVVPCNVGNNSHWKQS